MVRALRLRVNRTKLEEQLSGYLFILPAVGLIGLFGIFPIGYALYMSLHVWRVRQGPFVGLANYERLLGDTGGFALAVAGLLGILIAAWWWQRLALPPLASWTQVLWRKLPALTLLVLSLWCVGSGWGAMRAAGDARFLRGIEITLYYALGTIPTQIALGLLIAFVLYQGLRGQEFFRAVFFVPYIVPTVAASVVFFRIFSSRETSFANTVLSYLGLEPLRWLQEPRPLTQVLFGWQLEGFWAGPSLALVVAILFGIWNYTGFNVLLFLAGLSNILRELYEAAEIDGASPWQSFRHITVPLLSPITFYLSIIGFIGVLQVFNTVYVMRSPQALGSMDVVGIVIFDTFFARNQYGLATAQAILLFLLILYVTLLQYRLFGGRVHRGG
jgi:multiple sugar transport system permease protein